VISPISEVFCLLRSPKHGSACTGPLYFGSSLGVSPSINLVSFSWWQCKSHKEERGFLLRG
jgi:hypothetical protein